MPILHRVTLHPRDGEKVITTDQVLAWLRELRDAGDDGAGEWHAVTGWGGKVRRIEVQIEIPDDARPVYAALGRWEGPDAEPTEGTAPFPPPYGEPASWPHETLDALPVDERVAGWHQPRA